MSCRERLCMAEGVTFVCEREDAHTIHQCIWQQMTVTQQRDIALHWLVMPVAEEPNKLPEQLRLPFKD